MIVLNSHVSSFVVHRLGLALPDLDLVSSWYYPLPCSCDCPFLALSCFCFFGEVLFFVVLSCGPLLRFLHANPKPHYPNRHPGLLTATVMGHSTASALAAVAAAQAGLSNVTGRSSFLPNRVLCRAVSCLLSAVLPGFVSGLHTQICLSFVEKY